MKTQVAGDIGRRLAGEALMDEGRQRCHVGSRLAGAVEGAERLLSALKVAYERNTEESTVAIAAIIDRRPLHLMIEGKGSLEGVSMRSDKSGERRLVWHAGNGADMVGLHTVSSLSLLVAALPEEERIAILSYRASKV